MPKGHKLSEETKKRMSEAHMGSKNHFYGKKHSKEVKERISNTKKGVITSDEHRNNLSIAMKKWYKENPNFKRGSWGNHTEETKRKISESHKGKILTKEHKEKIIKNLKGSILGRPKSIAMRKKLSETNMGHIVSEETRKKISKGSIGKKVSEETKKKLSLAFSGDKSSTWKGGVSCEPYCDAWADKEYKKDIRERDNNECQNPDCLKKSSRLSLHHIDYVKKNCEPNNLITLCTSCNAKANFNREYWKNLYGGIIHDQKNRDFKMFSR